MGYDDYGYDDDQGLGSVSDRTRRAELRGLRHPLSDPALVREFLGQDEAWLPADGSYTLIKDMGPAHALAAANFILDRAKATCLVLLAAGDDRVTEVSVADDRASRLTVIDSSLVQALIRRGRQASESQLPWTTALAR